MRHSEQIASRTAWVPPQVSYGNGLIRELTDTDERYAVATMEIPWDLVKDQVVRQPEHVIFVRSMDEGALQEVARQVPPVDLVIGLGGGSSHDTAKYVALKQQARLVQVPTIFGGDAAVTPAIGIRRSGKVTYIAHVALDRLVVDFSLIRQAPAELVTYGAADILSSHTALFDWRLAAERGQAEFDHDAADEARGFIETLSQMRDEVRERTDEGIRTIVEIFLGYAKIEAEIGTARAQEGSEHFFAYNLEYVTGRPFLHGKLLALGIHIMSLVQENAFEETTRLMREMGWAQSIAALGVTREEFAAALSSLPDFVKASGYYYSVIDEGLLNPALIDKLGEDLR